MIRVPTLRLIINDDHDNVGRELHRTVSLGRTVLLFARDCVLGGLAVLALIWGLANLMLSLGR